MKIAMVAPYRIWPPDEGGRVRAAALLTHLADGGHEVTLFCPRRGGKDIAGASHATQPALGGASGDGAGFDARIRVYELTGAGRRRQILSPEFLRRAPAVARRERFDVVISEYPWPGVHAWWLARRAGAALVLDAPNVEGERFRSVGSRIWRAVDGYERVVARLADAVWAVSEEDRSRFLARGVPARKLQVVPNGVDPRRHHPDAAARARVRAELGVDDATRLLLFFGQLDYAPNRQALENLAREVLPRLDRCGVAYVCAVAGKGGPARAPHQAMRLLGRVGCIADYINAADAVLAPVTSGGGTRLKVLESVACGTPVVATGVGAEGIDRAACGDLLVLSDDWDAFAAAAARTPIAFGRRVPAGFLERYGWDGVVKRIAWPGGG